MKVGVLCGGKSYEHEISIVTALDVMRFIDDGYLLYLNKNNDVFYYKNPNNILKKNGKAYKDIKTLYKSLKLDLIILCVHGRGMEDGTAQVILDYYDIPYIGTSLEGSYICMDKELTDLKLIKSNLPSVRKNTYHPTDDIKIDNYPKIVKPARSGSSLGITVIRNDEELKTALEKVMLYDDKIIIEDYIEHHFEYSVAVFKTYEIKCSKIEIIKSNNDIFDYNEKYINRKKGVKREFLKDVRLINEIEEIAKEIYKNFELSGIIRIDFLADNKNLYVNEINTIPGSLANYMFDDFKSILTDLMNNKMYETKTKIRENTSINKEIVLLNTKK